MEKETSLEPVSWLQKEFVNINFPEYQREPNVWSKDQKQRLIDSMVRDFDIASLYFYEDEDGSLDCIDGRQRIGAIMSFLGENQDDQDNGYDLKFLNEIYTDEDRPFANLEGMNYSAIKELANDNDEAEAFVNQIRDYRLTIVRLSQSNRPDEFNLQFTRLNLGTIINSGEKLHAMVGELRDACFDEEDGIGAHAFLAETSIPTRRFAREQVAAQILAQVFSLRETDSPGFTRTRHYDLQRFFKQYSKLNDEQRTWIDDVRSLLDHLSDAFDDVGILRNRALTVSTVLLGLRRNVNDPESAEQLANFMVDFLCRLKWQVGKYKDLEPDQEYRYLIDFQRYVTQASVERPAVEARAERLEHEFDQWIKTERLSGDDDYEDRTGENPREACQGDAAG